MGLDLAIAKSATARGSCHLPAFYFFDSILNLSSCCVLARSSHLRYGASHRGWTQSWIRALTYYLPIHFSTRKETLITTQDGFIQRGLGTPSKSTKLSRSLAGEQAQRFGWPRIPIGSYSAFRSLLVITNFSWPWQTNRYVALKITNCFERDRKSAKDELEMSQHISHIQTVHEGRSYVRLIQDSFTIPGPFGEHLGMVFEPLREPLWLLGRHLGTVGLPSTILKAFLKLVLKGLDFLHSECHIIHTGECTAKHAWMRDRLTVKHKTSNPITFYWALRTGQSSMTTFANRKKTHHNPKKSMGILYTNQGPISVA